MFSILRPLSASCSLQQLLVRASAPRPPPSEGDAAMTSQDASVLMIQEVYNLKKRKRKDGRSIITVIYLLIIIIF